MIKTLKYILFSIAMLTTAEASAWKDLWYMDDIAFLHSNDPDDPQEQAAWEFFHKAYPNAYELTPQDFMELDNTNCRVTMIWIHADRGGVEKGWRNLARFYTVAPDASGPEVYSEPETDIYGEDGFPKDLPFVYTQQNGMNEDEFMIKLMAMAKYHPVNMYFSGLAAQFIEGIRRVHPDDGIDLCESPSHYAVTEIRNNSWAVSPWIENQGNPDHAGFASYGRTIDNWILEWGHLVALERGDYEEKDDVHPLIGAADTPIYISNNNCMWSARNITDFDKRNRAVVQGTWGHQSGEVVPVGLVEFLRDNQGINIDLTVEHPELAKPGYASHIVVNGLACCYWQPFAKSQEGTQPAMAPSKEATENTNVDDYGENIHQTNLENFTFNTINYLARLTDYDYVTTGIEGIEPDIDPDHNFSIEVKYFTISGIYAGGSATDLSPGIYIKHTGNKVEKIAIR